MVKQPRGSTIGFYFAGLSKEQANEVRARLNDLAAQRGYTAKRGGTTGQGNAAAMLAALARGELTVSPNSNHD